MRPVREAASVATSRGVSQLRVLIVITTAAILVAGGFGRSSAAAGDKIAFTSDRDGNAEIYVMNDDGSEQTRLTNEVDADHAPDFSSDGKKIVFTSERDGNSEIYIMNADGSGQTRLTNHPAVDSYPAMSPDGTKIAFSSARSGTLDIFVMNADGTNQTNLINDLPLPDFFTDDDFPAWQPDGKKIYFVSDPDESDTDLYVMNADGSNQQQVTSGVFNFTHPDLAPGTSNQIAFTHDSSGNYEIYTAFRNLVVPRSMSRRTANTVPDAFPSWSPDGTQISFSQGNDGARDILVMSPGGEPARLTTDTAGPVDDYDPSFGISASKTENSGDDDGSSTNTDGSRDRLNCSDFRTQQDAQAVFLQDRTDPNRLDADKDGIACEELIPKAATANAIRAQPKLAG